MDVMGVMVLHGCWHFVFRMPPVFHLLTGVPLRPVLTVVLLMVLAHAFTAQHTAAVLMLSALRPMLRAVLAGAILTAVATALLVTLTLRAPVGAVSADFALAEVTAALTVCRALRTSLGTSVRLRVHTLVVQALMRAAIGVAVANLVVVLARWGWDVTLRLCIAVVGAALVGMAARLTHDPAAPSGLLADPVGATVRAALC
mmetsp:Transcript_125484/g.217589  ORF Transcript_125484/g.217589 Transcript_125484/m.217589 type:complete len:201 (-) Transcript_125484:75-677(-)